METYRDEVKPVSESEVVKRSELGFGERMSDIAIEIDTERISRDVETVNDFAAHGRIAPLDPTSPIAQAFEDLTPDSKATDDAETARRRVRLNFRLQPAEMLTGEASLVVQLEAKTKEAAALKEALLARTEEVAEIRGAFQDSEADVEKYRQTLHDIANALPSQDPIAMARHILGWSTR